MEKADDAELEEAHDLGQCLFHDPSARLPSMGSHGRSTVN